MAWKKDDKLHDNRYTIERELGRGRLDITYLARDGKGHSLVVKTLSDEFLSQLRKREKERLQEKYLQEAVKLARYRHPNIVRVKEPFLQGEQVCMAMEYVKGVDLASHAQKALPEQEALRYIQQIGEALKVVHEDGLVHRDVKPSNIMLRAGKPEAVLIDFALARGFNNALTTATTADSFAPIEVYQSGTQMAAYTDVYSLAATLYFLLTGQVPPSAMERSEGKAQLKAPNEINPQVSDRLSKAILEGMALAAQERPQTMQLWLDLLGVPSATPVPWRKWDLKIGLAVIGVVGVLGAIALWFTLKPASPPPQKSTPSDAPASQLR